VEPNARELFNAAFSKARYERYHANLIRRTGGEEIGFRLAETPVFLSAELRDRCVRAGNEIVAQLSRPETIARMRAAIPPERNVPGETPLPSFGIIDFALAQEADGSLGPRLVEIQGFPSLIAFQWMQREAWSAELQTMPGLDGEWSCFFGGLSSPEFLDLAYRTIVGAHDPAHVALVDIDPPAQKTSCDFRATETLFGVDAVCPTKLEKRGKRLFRRDSAGRELPVERIYWRIVIDELEKKGVTLPFDLRDELDVEWTPHPNWFFIWSKYSLPFLDHPAVPRTRLLSEIDPLPPDLSTNYVLKPLFSFAGGGVNVAPTEADVAAIPPALRGAWCLQEKIAYAPALRAVDGGGVKAEMRMMYLRPDDATELTPAINLCRLARGPMIGVDFNRDMTWVGSSIGLWVP
jgi:hypothetical protein